MRGRKPKPTAKKKLEGNPGKRTLNKREPKPKVSPASTEPRTKKRAATDAADLAAIAALYQAFCARYEPLLVELKVLTDADHAAFDLMAQHYAIACQAAAIAQREGLVSIDKFMQAHKHPALQILRDNSAMFRTYAIEFGLTPSARSRIEVPDSDDLDPLERELFGPVIHAATRSRASAHE